MDKQRTPRPVSKQSQPHLTLKFVECGLALILVVVGRDTWPAVLVRGNVHLALQPIVAGATFLVYCPLLLLGFAINRPTPPMVMMAMTLLGLVHFLFEASTCGVYWADLVDLGNKQRPDLPLGPELAAVNDMLEALGAEGGPRLAGDRLLLQCMIATATTAAFLADAFLTAKYALLRPQPQAPLSPLF